MKVALAVKIEKLPGLEEGTLMILQIYYDIKIENQKHLVSIHPDFSIIRRILFWDTDINKIDRNRYDKYVITRVFERVNDEEKKRNFKVLLSR